MTINQMMERLEESFQKLSRFTADAAHELRTPLAALKGETEVLLSRKRSSEDYQEALTNNLERFDFLTKLVNGLLILSQADEGKASLKIENINFSELLNELYEAFNIVAIQKKIDFTFSAPEEVLINGDSIKLKQLFSNLIDNAIKHAPEASEVTVCIGKAKSDSEALRMFLNQECAVISVRDQGPGIRADEARELFSDFFVGASGRAKGGIGLGLAITKEIVHAHGGQVEARASDSGGYFVITIPLKLQDY